MSTSHRRSVVLLAVCLVMACESRLVTVSGGATTTWVERGLEPFTLTVGRQRAVGLPLGRPASWGSSDVSVATVTQQGVVTAQNPGTARIVAYASPDVMTTVVTVIADSTLIADSTHAPPPSQPVASVATVVVSLDATTLHIGQTAHGTVEARDTSGTVVTGKTPTWASQNAEVASVSPSGIVTAVRAGTTMIQATIDGVAGATLLTVPAAPPSTEPTPPAPDSVLLVLDAGSYASGSYAIEARTTLAGVASVRFIVDGSVHNTENISKYCLFGGDASCATGSLGAGSHTIQAIVLNSAGATIGRSAVMSIVDGGALAPAPAPAPTPTTPQTSGSTTHPNEPAGFGRFASQSMDALSNADYVPSDPGGGGRLSIVPDPSNPGSSGNVAQLLFPAGFGSGSAPESMYPTGNYSPQPKQLYVHFFVKLSSNWYGNTTAGINKILFVTFGVGHNDPSGSAVIEFAAMGGIDGTEQTLQPSVSPEGMIRFVDTGDGVTGNPSLTLGVNRVPYTFSSQVTRGEWHRFESLITINTPGMADGGIQWWWDGKLYGEYLNRIQWSGDGKALFQNVVWSPTYGGGSGQAVPADQYMWLKDLYVSGR